MNLQIVPLRPEHAAITAHLRQQDLHEICASTDLSPELAVSFSIAYSERGFAAILDGELCAIFGVNYGVIWFVGTDTVARHPVTFYRASKKIFPQLSHGYPELYNFVHVTNALSLRWLRWLGFIIDKPIGNFHYVHFHNKEA